MVQTVDYLAIAPPLILALCGLAALFLRYAAFVGLVLAGAFEVVLLTGDPRRTFCVDGSCSFVVDDFTLLFQTVMLIAGLVVLLMAQVEVRDTRLPAGEFHFLTLAAMSGALTLAAGRDLVTLLVSLEVVSLPLFALVALRRYDGRSSEAGVKMFLVSVVSTAVMLFGISLVYGATGSLFLDRIGAVLATPSPLESVAGVGVVLVLVGFGFKVSAVPFHFWAPDTYQGSPVAVAAFLSVISKAAGFAGLALVLTIAFGPFAAVWGPLVAVLAAVSMTVGNLVALRQKTAMRLLAWSSIAQAGYMLAPLGAAGGGAPLDELVAATIGYVAIYAVMNIGVFAVISVVGWIGDHGGGALDDYRGLARTHPLTAVALAFFLACLAGLPPGLAGLFAKIVVFQGTILGGYGWLAVIMAVNTVIGLFYYLTWATRLFAPLPQGATFGRIARPVGAAIGVAAVGTVLVSFAPQLVLGISLGG
ncbi:NADH-quinone oxidoreductase subunit N [Kibdelosporangium aridum]|uniref:NADH-quinone oxidoreductase subunit N n=1 Tax=Kibdelosporangium aridum TaxID=2030 RepID=A0A428ZAA1_KIBAR|nr:NADH-quinone oxidoreductase subunit N [Kibdelosporangium aridum]RSM84995.1 NADH-quinone oxidoreductase subunit N [Kibdelosporangium aridum]